MEFSYPQHDDIKVLNDVSIQVSNDKNRVVALVGHSGCGKSSVISLIEQFYRPTRGHIYFNGVNVKDLDPKWYHKQVAIVQQEPILFSGDIRSNIFYGMDITGYSEPELVQMLDEATRLASAYDFIHDMRLFPLGYQTIVGDRGIKLSGG